MPRHYTKYTKEILEPIVNSSFTYAECLRKLGLNQAGGNYKQLQINIDKFKLDVSHMKHRSTNQGREFKTFNNLRKLSSIKDRLIKERGHLCESCNLDTWFAQPIVLELHHIDGNNRNNVKENLKLLCPNCHSLTHNWRNRK